MESSLRHSSNAVQPDGLQEGVDQVRHAVERREEGLSMILETMQIVQGPGLATGSTKGEVQHTAMEALATDPLQELRSATQRHLREQEGYRDLLLEAKAEHQNLEAQLSELLATGSPGAASSSRAEALIKGLRSGEVEKLLADLDSSSAMKLEVEVAKPLPHFEQGAATGSPAQVERQAALRNIQDPDAEVRMKAVQMLGNVAQVNDERVICAICERIADKDLEVSRVAVKSLEAIASPGNECAIDQVCKHLVNDDSGVRQLAIDALLAVTGSHYLYAEKVLRTCGSHTERHVRMAAQEALTKVYDARARVLQQVMPDSLMPDAAKQALIEGLQNGEVEKLLAGYEEETRCQSVFNMEEQQVHATATKQALLKGLLSGEVERLLTPSADLEGSGTPSGVVQSEVQFREVGGVGSTSSSQPRPCSALELIRAGEDLKALDGMRATVANGAPAKPPARGRVSFLEERVQSLEKTYGSLPASPLEQVPQHADEIASSPEGSDPDISNVKEKIRLALESTASSGGLANLLDTHDFGVAPSQASQLVSVTFQAGRTAGLRYGRQTGAVLSVIAGSPADRAGVKAGYTMVKIDVQNFSDAEFIARIEGNRDFVVGFAADGCDSKTGAEENGEFKQRAEGHSEIQANIETDFSTDLVIEACLESPSSPSTARSPSPGRLAKESMQARSRRKKREWLEEQLEARTENKSSTEACPERPSSPSAARSSSPGREGKESTQADATPCEERELDAVLLCLKESATAVADKYRSLAARGKAGHQTMVKIHKATQNVRRELRRAERDGVTGLDPSANPIADQDPTKKLWEILHGHKKTPSFSKAVRKVMGGLRVLRMMTPTHAHGLLGDLSIDKVLNLEDDALEVRTVTSWRGLNVFDLERNGMPSLSRVFMSIFKFRSFNRLCLASEDDIAQLILAIEESYKDTWYHNRAHAAEAVATSFFLTRQLTDQAGMADYFTDVDWLQIVFSACVHDMRHPGLTNDFLVKTRHALALRYNDRGVLENYHAASAFEVQRDKGIDILETRSATAPISAIRARVVEMILATDMAHHKEIHEKLSHEVVSHDTISQVNKVVLEKNILHLADIGHPLRQFAVHHEFSRRITMEFFAQGDAETQLGFEPMALFDRSKAPPLPKGQLGFINFVFRPAWTPMLKALGRKSARDLEECLGENIAEWERQAAAIDAETTGTNT